MSARSRTVAALAFLLALAVGFYWQLTLSSEYTWLENPDQALQVRPWLDYEARELHSGRLPLWDPYQVGGQSLLGQVQPGLANPLNWILFAIPLRDGHIPLGVLHWYWVLIHWVAAAFCFWLCRDLGAGVWPSILGASIFAFAGFMGHHGTPQFLMSGLWIPVILLFFARVFRSPAERTRAKRPLSAAALCGLAMGAAVLSGHHNVPIYTAVLLGAAWLWYLVVPRAGGDSFKLRLAAALVFVTIGFLVSALQMFPAIEYGRQALRWSGVPEPQRWHDKLPYIVHQEYSLKPDQLWGLITYVPAQSDPFVGFAALVLSATAVILRRRSRDVRLLAFFALGGLLLALGSNTPVQYLAYKFLPMVDKARYPAMAIVLFQTAIAALAALGLEALIGHRPAWLRLSAAALFLAVFVVEVSTDPPPIRRRDVPDSLLAKFTQQADIGEFLKHQPGWFRIQVDADVVPYNFGDWYSIEQFDGYTASMLERVNRFLGNPAAPRFFGLRYFVGRAPANASQVEVFASRSGVKVYLDPRIGDPLFAVHEAPCNSADRLAIVSRTPNEFVIDADLACAGRVVSGDPWSQGWRAYVDEKRIRIQEFEGVSRAVPVDAGHHRIAFKYRPGSFYWGAGLSVLGLLLTGTICRRERRR